jgi:hypothetical protein
MTATSAAGAAAAAVDALATDSRLGSQGPSTSDGDKALVLVWSVHLRQILPLLPARTPLAA